MTDEPRDPRDQELADALLALWKGGAEVLAAPTADGRAGKALAAVKGDVQALCRAFPLYPGMF